MRPFYLLVFGLSRLRARTANRAENHRSRFPEIDYRGVFLRHLRERSYGLTSLLVQSDICAISSPALQMAISPKTSTTSCLGPMRNASVPHNKLARDSLTLKLRTREPERGKRCTPIRLARFRFSAGILREKLQEKGTSLLGAEHEDGAVGRNTEYKLAWNRNTPIDTGGSISRGILQY